jgi:hypothetical protein
MAPLHATLQSCTTLRHQEKEANTLML